MPSTDADLFTEEAMLDPFPIYRSLRALGPVVRLDRYALPIVTRFAESLKVLGDWKTFSSAKGVAANDAANEGWRTTIIGSDPPRHSALRAVLADRLGPKALDGMQGDLEARADRLVERVVSHGRFDMMEDIARAFAMDVVFGLVGFKEEGRRMLVDLAEANFNAAGPPTPHTMKSFPFVQRMWDYLTAECGRDAFQPGTFGHTIYEAAERGDIAWEDTLPLLHAYATPGVDTTISSLGSAIHLFALHPDQWDAVVADPRLIRNAYNEVVRLESPVQMFTRVATRDTDIGGVPITGGQRFLVGYGCANRCEIAFPDGERFDIRRRFTAHVGFGAGIHQCPGQGLARLEAHAVLLAMSRRVRRFHIDGPVLRVPLNVTRSLKSLPIRAEPLVGAVAGPVPT